MVEVFKTNVDDPRSATILVATIQKTFAACSANFDLDDCDRILRIEFSSECIEAASVIGLLSDFGFSAQVLSDENVIH
jgi:hypothetical protein